MGAVVSTIVAHFGFMQKPDVPRILQEVNAHPELQHLDLSLANIEIGEEEIMVDPELPWWRKLCIRAFVFSVEDVSPLPTATFGLRWDHPM